MPHRHLAQTALILYLAALLLLVAAVVVILKPDQMVALVAALDH
jgi:hypothetical protein